MAGYVMKMSILVSNINHRGQKDLSFEVRHKPYASRYHALKKDSSQDEVIRNVCFVFLRQIENNE